MARPQRFAAPWFFFALGFLLLPLTALATDYYVVPGNRPSGAGSLSNPWDLTTALAQPAAIKPGDTVWLRGGTYNGTFKSNLTGTVVNPIIVRQYPGERATLDGGTSPPTYSTPVLTVNGGYTWFRDFEITNSNTTRTTTNPGSNPPNGRGDGIDVLAPGTKVLNMVIHDTGQGLGLWTPATDSEAYGNLIYYNGWDAPDRGHGHGIYTQNQAPSVKQIRDNILFDQFGYGIHAYTEGGTLDNLYFEGNTSFNNGGLSQVRGFTTNFLVGASGSPATSCTSSVKVAQKPTLIDNYSYCPQASCTGLNLGYSKGTCDATVKGNYFVSREAFDLVKPFGVVTITGNTFYGSVAGFSPLKNPGNTYYAESPTGVKIFLRPNLYEPGRANIIVYNWDHLSTVQVTVNGVLSTGDSYEVRNAQDYFGQPVLSGIAPSSSFVLTLPMTGLHVAVPMGVSNPTATGPEFNAFVLLKTSSGRPTATPAKTGTTPTRPPTRG